MRAGQEKHVPIRKSHAVYITPQEKMYESHAVPLN